MESSFIFWNSTTIISLQKCQGVHLRLARYLLVWPHIYRTLFHILPDYNSFRSKPWTTDNQWRHKSKKYENLGWYGRQNMLWLYLKICEWEWIFGRAVKAISSLGVRSPWSKTSYQSLVFLLINNLSNGLGLELLRQTSP